MSALDIHYITIEEKNKLRLDHVIFIVKKIAQLLFSKKVS